MTSNGRASIGRWLKKRSENVIVALMSIMFVSFLLQIAFRYLLNQPLGWTDEVTVLCWLWVVLWGAAFFCRDRTKIRFDIVSGAVRHPSRVHADHRASRSLCCSSISLPPRGTTCCS
jgi:TRAP-type C4-dicarboxylate transport system permease small subunit